MPQTEKTTRYFLFSYATRNNVGNVKCISDTFPSELWLKTQAIPKVARYLDPFDNIVITGFFEFPGEDDFNDFIGGHSMEEEIQKLFS